LEKLSGDREGQHSVRINQQWRICFRWKNGDCYDVEIKVAFLMRIHYQR